MRNYHACHKCYKSNIILYIQNIEYQFQYIQYMYRNV